jgi:hypothetical protein
VGKHSDSRLAEAAAERRGIDRRTLIKGAAVAGAVGWTAPIIIESLTSPAAAITAPAGCFIERVNINCHPDCNNAPASVCFNELSCLCTDMSHNPLVFACLTNPAEGQGNCNGSVSVSFSINPGCNCTFTAAAAKKASPASGCTTLDASHGVGTKMITFDAAVGFSYNQYQLQITCV